MSSRHLHQKLGIRYNFQPEQSLHPSLRNSLPPILPALLAFIFILTELRAFLTPPPSNGVFQLHSNSNELVGHTPHKPLLLSTRVTPRRIQSLEHFLIRLQRKSFLSLTRFILLASPSQGLSWSWPSALLLSALQSIQALHYPAS